MLKIIKSESEYLTALSAIEELMDLDPEPGSKEGEKLELLLLLVNDYEQRILQLELPEPIEAIEFRMEQQNLTQRDLVPLLGSRSKVSEVLARKRPLTLSMIRALHNGLGIPAKVLLQEQNVPEAEALELDWSRFPIREMVSRGWISEKISNLETQAEEVVRKFLSPIGSTAEVFALYRKGNNIRSARSMDDYALLAWTARVIIKASENPPPIDYKKGSVTLTFMQELTHFSLNKEGPILVRDFLKQHGINLIIEPHLPRTHLDGAAILINANNPIIGLTLRYDRIDNFWFCLMHELAHISLHLGEGITQFYDDLDVEGKDNQLEIEADELAGEALIPEDAWKRSAASNLRSPEAAEDLAHKLGIHPGIVAGRMRHEFKAYRLLNRLVGHREVRKLFSEINWEK